MENIEKIVNSFGIKIISIVVIILDFVFLILGFCGIHGVHTAGLFITCFVDVILGAEILLQFYVLGYDKKRDKAVLEKYKEKCQQQEIMIQELRNNEKSNIVEAIQNTFGE